MKTILVLTDFSDNAAHAAQSAVKLAGKLHANVLLFNAYQTIPVTNYYTSTPWGGEDTSYWEHQSKNHIADFQNHLESVVSEIPPEEFKPAISNLCGEGSLGELVKEIDKRYDIELIVMGSRSDNSFEHIFYGSDTYSVIEHASRPVLILRTETELKKLDNVIVATNFSQEDLKSLRYLTRLGQIFNTKFELVHIMPSEETGTLKTEKEIDFMEQVAGLKYPHIAFKDVRGKEVIQRLNRLCEEDNADALAIIHHPRSFFSRMLKLSLAYKALDQQKIPLLVFPAKMDLEN